MHACTHAHRRVRSDRDDASFFGEAFVEDEDDIVGLVHISQLSKEHVAKVKGVIKAVFRRPALEPAPLLAAPDERAEATLSVAGYSSRILSWIRKRWGMTRKLSCLASSSSIQMTFGKSSKRISWTPSSG